MDVPESVLGLLRRIVAAQAKAADDWARDLGLSIGQALTLGWLVDNPGAIQRDVAQMSRTTAASASSLLQGLERRGLVDRRSEKGDDRQQAGVRHSGCGGTDLRIRAGDGRGRAGDPGPAQPGGAGILAAAAVQGRNPIAGADQTLAPSADHRAPTAPPHTAGPTRRCRFALSRYPLLSTRRAVDSSCPAHALPDQPGRNPR